MCFLSPQAMLNGGLFTSDEQADEIVSIAVRKSLNVEKDWCSLKFQFKTADGMNFLFADRECFQRMVIFLLLVAL